MKQDFEQPSSFGLPACPYCGKRLNPLVAWLYKTKGEYQCPHCSQFSNVTADSKTPIFGLIAIGISLAVFLIFLFANGKLPLWAISLLVAPFLLFTILAPFLVRLEKIQVPSQLKQPERVPSRRKPQRPLPRVGDPAARPNSQPIPQNRPAPQQSRVNPDSPYAHPASKPPQSRNPQPPKNYTSSQRPVTPSRPVQTNRPMQQPVNPASMQQNRTPQANRPVSSNRPVPQNRPTQPQPNRPVQTNRPAARPNLYPSMPPRAAQKPAQPNRPAQQNRPGTAGRPNQTKPNSTRPASPNLFDTAEFGKRPPKDFSGYQDK